MNLVILTILAISVSLVNPVIQANLLILMNLLNLLILVNPMVLVNLKKCVYINIKTLYILVQSGGSGRVMGEWLVVE